MTPETATFAEFAALVNCKLSHVRYLRDAGRLVLTDDGKSVLVAESLRRMAEPVDPNKAVVSQAEFAVIANWKQSYVKRLRAEGRLVLAEDGKSVLVAESFARIAATRDPAKAGVVERHAAARAAQQAADASDSTEEENEPQAPPGLYGSHAERRAKALADDAEESARRKRRENDVEEGRLLRREQVEAVFAQAGNRFRLALESSAHSLAPELAAIDDEGQVAALLSERFERLLANLSRDLAEFAKGGEA